MNKASDPNKRQMATLQAVAADGGFQNQVADTPAADECCWEGWLLAEGETGYALTIDGRATLRRLF